MEGCSFIDRTAPRGYLMALTLNLVLARMKQKSLTEINSTALPQQRPPDIQRKLYLVIGLPLCLVLTLL